MHTAIIILNIGANALMALLRQLIDNIMSELSSNSGYEYLHIVTLSATTAYGLVTALVQFSNTIISQLSGHSCYKNFNLYTLASVLAPCSTAQS